MNAERLTALSLAAAAACAAFGAVAAPVSASGGGHNVVILVDPEDVDDARVAEHYAQVRGVPGRNLIVMETGASDLAALHDWQIPALLGELSTRGIDDHVDIVALGPGSPFYVDAPGLIDAGGCPAPVRRISLASAYGLAYEGAEILGGGLDVHELNRYYAVSDAPRAFDSRTLWEQGAPSTGTNARRYFVGMALGYSGPQGNTITETLAMIDRSVAADATQPYGTFYFMDTPDGVRTAPRRFQFTLASATLRALGAKAEILNGVLPGGRHDALGVLTGYADPQVEAADLTLLPGSYADHLTSYGATFDTTSQMRISSWIRSGASGAHGTVEEPCAIAAKFANARLFVWTFQGMALGEALFRSLGAAPFHGMAYGDPLVQPFARRPVVEAEFPANRVSGRATLSVSATMPGGVVDRADLYIDGVLVGGVAGTGTDALTGAVSVDTRRMPDGEHEFAWVAMEGSGVRAQANVAGRVKVDNRGDSVTLEVSGDAGPFLQAHMVAPGATELRLVRGHEVIAAAAGERATLSFLPAYPGVPVALSGEAVYPDGHMAIARHDGTPRLPAEAGVWKPPLEAYSFAAAAVPGMTHLLDLPHSVPDGGSDDPPSVEILTQPSQAALRTIGHRGFLQVEASATGADRVVFRTVQGAAHSEPATVTLEYCPAPVVQRSRLEATVCAGDNADLFVAVQGETVTYQWRRDGQTIPGATEPHFVVTQAAAADAGTYEVTVRHWCGRVAHTLTLPARLDVTAGDQACRRSVYLPAAQTGPP